MTCSLPVCMPELAPCVLTNCLCNALASQLVASSNSILRTEDRQSCRLSMPIALRLLNNTGTTAQKLSVLQNEQ